jgi:hypothetical protein
MNGITIKGQKAARGERMTPGRFSRWELAPECFCHGRREALGNMPDEFRIVTMNVVTRNRMEFPLCHPTDELPVIRFDMFHDYRKSSTDE